MKYLFVMPLGEYYSRQWSGAIATITRYVAAELIHMNNEVAVLTPDDGGDLHDAGDSIRLSVGSAHRRSLLSRLATRARRMVGMASDPEYHAYLRSLRSAVRDQDGTPRVVVVANDPRTAATLAGEPDGEKVILWLHNRLEGSAAAALASLPASVIVVAVSQSVKTWTQELCSAGTDIHVLYSGVDAELFHPRPDWLEPRARLSVVCHARIDPNKGQDAIASAVARLRSEGLPVDLTVIGEMRTFGFDEAAESAYRLRLESELERANAVRIGWLPLAGVAEELRRHDVACVLSRVDDPFPLASLEAMASGCSIIGTRKGGIPEAIGDAGVLVAPDSPDEVANVLRQWIIQPDLLATMKRAARERAAQFSWSHLASQLTHLAD